MRSKIETFFDELAATWDTGEDFHAKEREELVASLPIQKGDHLLDIACGTGVLSEQLYSLSTEKVTSIDISGEMIRLAKEKRDLKKAEYIHADFSDWESEQTFDGAVIFNAYPHILDRDAFKKNLLRYLKQGGFFAILHNESREALEEHHSSEAAKQVTRDLDTPMEEASFYADSFEILAAEESDHSYRILLRKK